MRNNSAEWLCLVFLVVGIITLVVHTTKQLSLLNNTVSSQLRVNK